MDFAEVGENRGEVCSFAAEIVVATAMFYFPGIT